MTRMGLVRLDGEDIALTDEGRAYALRMVRTHRIWERYLADRTGVGSGEWHTLAERLEHGARGRGGRTACRQHGRPAVRSAWRPHPDCRWRPSPGSRGAAIRHSPRDAALASCTSKTSPSRSIARSGPRASTIGSRDCGWSESMPPASSSSVEGRPVTMEPAGGAEPHRRAAWRTTPRRRGSSGSTPFEPGEEGSRGSRWEDRCRAPSAAGCSTSAWCRAPWSAPSSSSLSGDPMAYRIRGAVIALRRAQADDILIRRRRSTRRPRDARSSASACRGCGNRGESLIQLGVAPGPLGLPRGPGRQSEHRQEHRLQRADRPAAAHRQLARQDGRARRGDVQARAGSRSRSSTCPAPTRCRRRAPTRKWRATSCSSASRT